MVSSPYKVYAIVDRDFGELLAALEPMRARTDRGYACEQSRSSAAAGRAPSRRPFDGHHYVR
jgi:hypothetical protein